MAPAASIDGDTRPCAATGSWNNQCHCDAPAGGVEILIWPSRFTSRLQARWCWQCCHGHRRHLCESSPLPAGSDRSCGGPPRALSLRVRRGNRSVADAQWIPAMGIHYALAADGISRVLILLTGLAAVAGILFSWNIGDKEGERANEVLRLLSRAHWRRSTASFFPPISFCSSSSTKSRSCPSTSSSRSGARRGANTAP